MKRPVKLGIASLKALAVFVVLGAVAHAGMPYLPLIGPPPIRFPAVKSSAPAVVKFEATPALFATNLLMAPAMSAATNLTVPLPTPATMVLETPSGALGDTFTSSIFQMPTPDLLGITPQMLATYFHPVQMGTNFPAPTAPFQVIFMPPVPPDTKSSHAEYILK
jgi:hypothetical protein